MTRPSSRSLKLSKSKGTPQQGKSTPSLASRASVICLSGNKLKTPIRRLFFGLGVLKPSANGIGTKRARMVDDDDSPLRKYGSTSDPTLDSPPPSSDAVSSAGSDSGTPRTDRFIRHTRSPAQHYTPSVPCMALQNSDHSIDAVVISTLLKLPFCCHEDLLTMEEGRIIEVAQEMNERLPEALRIDLSEPRDADAIRREVEVLVGIVKASRVPVPGAPLKSRGQWNLGRIADPGWVLDELDFKAISPPTSPLALVATRPTRRRVGAADTAMVMSPTKLAMLREEDESEQGEVAEEVSFDAPTSQVKAEEDDPEDDFFRATKKRKVSASSEESVEMITPTMRHIKVPLMLRKLYDDMNNTSPTPLRVLRSHSERMPTSGDSLFDSAFGSNGKVVVKTTVIDRSLAHTRARYRSASRFTHVQTVPQIGREMHGPLQTSTPNNSRRVREDLPIPSYAFATISRSPQKPRRPSNDGHRTHVRVSKIPSERRVRRRARYIVSDMEDLTVMTKRTF